MPSFRFQPLLFNPKVTDNLAKLGIRLWDHIRGNESDKQGAASDTAQNNPQPAQPEQAPHGNAARQEQVAEPVQQAPRSVVVQPGDSLYAIAQRELGDGNRYLELAQLNGIANPSALNAGQTIQLPGGAAPSPLDLAAEQYGTSNGGSSGDVAYRNQRDNAGTHVIADWMCNMTSLAMSLEDAGVELPKGARDSEDLMDEWLVNHSGLHADARYEQAGQAAVASHLGATVDRRWCTRFSNAGAAQNFFEKNINERFDKPNTGATVGMKCAGTPSGHIVRLQSIGADGIVVDDPFGKLVHRGGSRLSLYNYSHDKNTREDDHTAGGSKGNDNVWDWSTVAAVCSGRYVQFVTKN